MADQPGSGRQEAETPPPQASRRSARVLVRVLAAAVLGFCVVLRFWTTSQLWLDEALSVNIARLPLTAIPAALRHDGSPPVYYVALHFWMLAFGTGDVAVRALSGLFSLATLVALFFAARLYGRRSAAWAAVLLAATSPFAVRYATETRMYSLMMLEVTLGFIVLVKVLRRPSALRVCALGVLSLLALLTHYWSFYVLGVVGAILAGRWLVRKDRAALWALVAMAGAGVGFLPWLPSFVFQLRHTGTPWATRPSLTAPLATITQWAGGSTDTGVFLGAALLILAVVGLFGAGVDRRRIELDLRTRPEARWLAVVTFAALSLAVAAGRLSSSAFVSRYSAVVFPLFVLLVAQGVETLLHPPARHGLLAVVLVLGLAGSVGNVTAQRTQAGPVARAVNAHASPGDVVAFCPDQLGPAVSRLLTVKVTGLTFPNGGSPLRVDWVDYAKRNRSGNVNQFAGLLEQRAGSHTIWLVWQGGYRTLGDKCQKLARRLAVLRPARTWVVTSANRYYEHFNLIRYPG